jgi:2-polyprenyl-3-methyl-5-hydroxy-6-metoxy-1,4-benzoquinol methylase
LEIGPDGAGHPLSVIADRIARRFEGRWRQGYVRSKLRTDPVFATAVELLKDAAHPVLDLGCGLGLFGFHFRESGGMAPVHGLDFDAGKIAAAQRVAASHAQGLTFEVGDVRALDGFRGHVVLFDVLHYLTAAQQAELLTRVAAQVAPGALCLIRATPRDGSWRFRVTQVQEFFLRASCWMKTGAVHYATADEILAPFRARGFACEVRPLWGRTPFNSHLFILRAAAP